MSGSQSLYVTGIPPDMLLDGFRNLFGRCGKVTGANMLDPKGTHVARAGFIEYAKPLEALKAVEMFGNYKVGVHTIRAAYSKKSKQEGARDFDASKINLSELVERNIDHSAKRADERLKRPGGNANQNKGLKSALYACNTCGKMCNTACSVCNSVHYCGSSCQKEDWPVHKKVCKSGRSATECSNIKSPDRSSNSSEGVHVEIDAAFVNELSQQFKSCVNASSKSNGSVPGSVPVEIPSPVKAGSNAEVQLLDLEDSGLIVCLTAVHNPDFAKLDTLHKYYSDGHGEVPSVVEAGSFYACPFSTDAVWYRVFVVDVSDDASTCRVWYVDFGNFENAQTSNLRILTPDYAAVPMRTVRCKLCECDRVAPSKIRDFITEALSDAVVKIKVLKVVAAVAIVEMYGLVEGKLSFVNNLLVGGDTTSNKKHEQTPNSAKDEVCPDKKQMDQIDITSRHNVNISPSVSTTTSVLTTRMSLGTVPKSGAGDANSLSESTQIAKSSSKLQSIFKKFHSKASQNYPELEIQPIVVPKGKFNGVVTHVESVEELYVCLESDKEIVCAMQSSLKEACSQDIIPQPYKKDMVCAYFDDASGTCHRGRILATKGEKMKLFLLDDGRKKIVHSGNVHKLPADSKYFVPPKAIPCKLKGFTPGDAGYNAESVSLLKNCENEVMTMEVDRLREDGFNPVTIYVSVEGTWMTVNWCVDNLRGDCELPCPSPRESLGGSEMLSPQERVTEATPAAATKSECLAEVGLSVNHKSAHDSIANSVPSPKNNSTSGSTEVSPAVTLPTPPISEILVEGKEIRIAITNLVSPAKFTFHILPGSYTEFNRFCNDMTAHYSKQDAKRPDTIQIGGVYAARYRLDERWYRAKVSEAVPDADAFKVVFVDFGNVEDVSRDDVRDFHEDYTKMPIQGMEGGLYRYSPIDDDSVSECVRVMRSMMSDEITAVVRGRSEDGDRTLLDIKTADDRVLTDLFVQHQLAKLSHSEEVEDRNCVKADIEASAVTSTCDSHKTGSSNSMSNVPDEHVARRIIPVSPTVGETRDVIVVHAVDPSEFYCQLIADELKAVLIKMSELNARTAEIEMSASGAVGEYCLARSSDGQLYRAEITANDKDDSFTVRFIDYGNSESVPVGNVTNMPEEYSGMESQAVKCKLHGCGPVDGAWSAEAIGVMKFLIERLGKAKFIGRGADDVFEISLLLEDGTDVGEYLIQEQFAEKSDPIEGGNRSTLQDAPPDSAPSDAKGVDVEKAEASVGSTGMFGVKITMIAPPVNVDQWPAEFAQVIKQCEGKLVQACVKREDDAERWSLTIPDVFKQVMEGA